ncbi:hypothetical protein TcWFU_007982 [Taenia crassiceps]|uniref:Uncharacterized protein n=1 Tax=Taenia crassiceps TaxID=6207 RepID=A0ABR4Q8K7_9CEST
MRKPSKSPTSANSQKSTPLTLQHSQVLVTGWTKKQARLDPPSLLHQLVSPTLTHPSICGGITGILLSSLEEVQSHLVRLPTLQLSASTLSLPPSLPSSCDKDSSPLLQTTPLPTDNPLHSSIHPLIHSSIPFHHLHLNAHPSPPSVPHPNQRSAFSVADKRSAKPHHDTPSCRLSTHAHTSNSLSA